MSIVFSELRDAEAQGTLGVGETCLILTCPLLSLIMIPKEERFRKKNTSLTSSQLWPPLACRGSKAAPEADGQGLDGTKDRREDKPQCKRSVTALCRGPSRRSNGAMSATGGAWLADFTLGGRA